MCPLYRCSGWIYSRCASVYGLQKERERVCRLLYPTGDRRFNSAMGVAGVYQSKKICNRRFSGIWYLLYGDNVAVIRKKFNAKELVKNILSEMRLSTGRRGSSRGHKDGGSCCKHRKRS